MMIETERENSINMKNRTINGIAMLCFFLITSLVSCKKEDISLQSDNVLEDTESFENPTFDIEPTLVENPYSADASASANTVSMDAMATSTYVRKNLIFNFNAETSTSLTYFRNNSLTSWAFNQKCCSYSQQRSTTYARSGSYSTRYELNKYDADVFGSKRTETGRYTRSEPTAKVERWYGASYYLPSDFVYDAAAESPTQWHTTSTRYPPLAIWIQKGQWRLVQFGNLSTVLGTYEKGKWTDFVFHVKWSSGTDGLIEIWKNGVKIFSKAGKNINAGITYGAYMRSGLYKWPWKSGSTSTTKKRVLYIDDVRIGNASATYNDVVPGL